MWLLVWPEYLKKRARLPQSTEYDLKWVCEVELLNPALTINGHLMLHIQVSPYFSIWNKKCLITVSALLWKELRRLVKVSLTKCCELLRSSNNLLSVDENADLPLSPCVLFISTPSKVWLPLFVYKALNLVSQYLFSSYICSSQMEPLTYSSSSTVSAFSLQ